MNIIYYSIEINWFNFGIGIGALDYKRKRSGVIGWGRETLL